MRNALGILLYACLSVVPLPIWAATSPRAVEGFVQVNGVQLQYLDWGGDGPAIILIHGIVDNPHVFDDFATAFASKFHVIAYARRGSGNSEVKGPYDIDTLTADLRALMDALKIQRATLVGYSAGGDEVTNFAAEYSERVDRIVYLDAAYDFADPDFRSALAALPSGFFDRPMNAMALQTGSGARARVS